MKKIIAAAILVSAASLTAVYAVWCKNQNGEYTSNFFAMDTAVSVRTSGQNGDFVKEKILSLDKRLDAYNDDSEIGILNSSKSAELSSHTIEFLKKSMELNSIYKNVDITSGALTSLWDFHSDNPSPPGGNDIKKALKTIGAENLSVTGHIASLSRGAKIDPGACAKGFACDEVSKELKSRDIERAVISFGSSVLMHGKGSFSLSIADPSADSNDIAGTLKTKACTVSTSGTYQRFFEYNGKSYSHILDLDTGYPADSDLMSVTVISDSGILTDFLSTSILIDGEENIEKHLNADNYSVIAISADNKIYISDKIKNSFEITNKSFCFA